MKIEHQQAIRGGGQTARMSWEAERIAEADADVAAGRLVDAGQVNRWIDSIGTSGELPLPSSGR